MEYNCKYYIVSVFNITTHHHTCILSLMNVFSNYNNYYILFEIIILCLELQDSQTLLMIEKKESLLKLKELDYCRKQIEELKEKLKLTSMLSSGLH